MKTKELWNPEPHVLITGGAGFIGSHLTDLLLARGETVWVLDDLSTGRAENLAHHVDNPRFRFFRGDVGDAELMMRLAENCHHLYHLAAVVGVQRVLESPLRCVEENIFGTRSVLNAAAAAGAKVFIASTSEIYGKNEAVPFSEESDCLMGPPQVGRWSYATSKAVDEILALGYAAERGLDVVVGRFFNTIGHRQRGHYGMVAPRFVAQALAGRAISVYGDGTQTRCFCDVRDTIQAVAGLMAHPNTGGQVYNIGSTEEVSIEQLARTVLSITDPQRAEAADAVVFVPYTEAYAGGYDEFPRRVPNATKIQRLLGWESRIRLRETLSWMAEGMRNAPAEPVLELPDSRGILFPVAA